MLMRVFNLIKRSSNKGTGKASVQGGRDSIFVPLLASCCVVLMCTSSCNKSDTGIPGSGTYGVATKGSDTVPETGGSDLFSTGSDGSESMGDLDLTSDEYAGPDQWYFFNTCPVVLKLDEGGKHHTMSLDGKSISSGDFGRLVLLGFLHIGRWNYSEDRDPVVQAKINELGGAKSGYEDFFVRFVSYLVNSEYAPSCTCRDYQFKEERVNHSSCDVSDVKWDLDCVVPLHIVHVLLDLAGKGKLQSASIQSNGLGYKKWVGRYNTLGNGGASQVDKLYACLGQDIIDALAAQQSEHREYKLSFSSVLEDNKGKSKKSWIFIDEVGLGSRLWPFSKSPIRYAAYKKSGKQERVDDVSFGFQAIAEVAKVILCGNFGKKYVQ